MPNFPLILSLFSIAVTVAVQPVAGGPCDDENGGCSHDCVEEAGGHRCTCPHPLKLKDDGRHCGAEGLKLTCNTNSMQIDLPRNLFHEMHDEHLRLIDPECGASSNGSFFSLATSHTRCGTTSRVVGGYIVYSNKVMEMPNKDSAVVTKVGKGEVQVPFSCYYLDREIVTAVGFKPVAKKLYVSVKGRGNYKLNLNFYKGSFNQRAGSGMYDQDDFPVQVKLRERLYFEASLDTKEKNLTVFAANCCSTPTQDHEATHKFRHALIVEGCPVDPSVQFHHSPSPTVQRFSVRAFKFLGNHPFVFIHCRIYVCDANDPDSRCAQGCRRPERGEDGSKQSSQPRDGGKKNVHHREPMETKLHADKKAAKVTNPHPAKQEKLVPHHEQRKVVHLSKEKPVKAIHNHEKQKKLAAPQGQKKVVLLSKAKPVEAVEDNEDDLKKLAPLKQKKETKPAMQPKQKKSSKAKIVKNEKKIQSHVTNPKDEKTVHSVKKSSVLKKVRKPVHKDAQAAEKAQQEEDLNQMIADLFSHVMKPDANHVTKRDVSHVMEDTTSGFVEISKGPFVVSEKPRAKTWSKDEALVNAKKNEIRADVKDEAKPGSPLPVSATDGVLVVMTVASVLALVGVIYLGRQATKRSSPYEYTPLTVNTS